MTRLVHGLLGAALITGGATGAMAAASRPDTTPPLAVATLATSSGVAAGTATITVSGSSDPVLRVTVSGLPAGVHGIHLHAVGKCEAPAFTSAGGHLNPTGRQHGHLNPAGSHLGDLPNITARADGTGELTQTLRGTAAALRNQLFDSDGTAIVVHATADDYRTDPSGNSGARIACGVLASG